MALPKFYLEVRNIEKKSDESLVEYDSRKDEMLLKINMFFSFNGQRIQYYTGRWIKRKYYKDYKGSGSKRIFLKVDRSDINKLISENAPYASVIKANLKQIALDAQNILNVAKANKIPLSVEYLRTELDKIHKPKDKSVEINTEPIELFSFFEQIIKDSKDGKRLIAKGRNSGGRYTHNAIKNYGVTLSALKRYAVYNKIKKLPLESVNKGFYEQFRSYIYDVEQKEKSTFAGYIKDIKTVMVESGYKNFRPNEFTMPSYESDTIYLKSEQIDMLAALDLTDHTKFYEYEYEDKKDVIGYGVLEKVRDLALVGFYTGLRFSDFSTLSFKNIDEGFIHVKQIKTGGRVSIPIMAKLRPVLLKYPDALPTLSNQRFNSWLKPLAKLAGLTELVEIKNTKGNVESKNKYPLYALLSSHVCRRSFCTNMFKAGIPLMLIASASGHRTEKNLLSYIRATSDEKSKIFSDELLKLGL